MDYSTNFFSSSVWWIWNNKFELNQNFPDLELKVIITNEELTNFLQYDAYN